MSKNPFKLPRLNPFMIIVMIFMAFFIYYSIQSKEVIQEIPMSDFWVAVEQKQLISVEVDGTKISAMRIDNKKIITYGPISEQLLKSLKDNKIKVTFIPPTTPNVFTSLLFSLLPIILIFGLVIWALGKLNKGGSSGAMSFGKSNAKFLDKEVNVSFKDVAGCDEAKHELVEVVEFLKDPKQFSDLGAKIPKGVLLVGGPGTGKTLLARAVAKESGVPFLTMSGSGFVEMFVGVGASRVRDLFEQAKKVAPCIIFIDEIDAVGRQRGAGMGGGNDEREQTLNQLLVEMDGFTENTGIIILAATNRADVLDPALLRPGRFDRQVYVPNPDIKGRTEILKVHTRKIPLDDSVDLSIIAKGTPGFSGADIANLVNEAALIGAREKSKVVTNQHLELAKDKVTMGPARKSMVLSDKEKESTAYHEIGHALVGWFTEAADPVYKVTIIPRGGALGVTMLLPEEDRHTYSSKQALAMIDYAMGGRAAEEIIYGQFTTGASNDIRKATDIARRMVCEWGMSSLGPISLSDAGHDPFVGKSYGQHNPISPEKMMEIDKEVSSIINQSYQRVKKLLEDKRDLLDKVTRQLIEKETLLGEEIKQVIEN